MRSNGLSSTASTLEGRDVVENWRADMKHHEERFEVRNESGGHWMWWATAVEEPITWTPPSSPLPSATRVQRNQNGSDIVFNGDCNAAGICTTYNEGICAQCLQRPYSTRSNSVAYAPGAYQPEHHRALAMETLSAPLSTRTNPLVVSRRRRSTDNAL